MKSFVRQVCTAILCVGMPPGAPVSDTVAQGTSKLTDMGSGTAAGIRDARTVLLADGRELRLAGIEVTDSSRGALQTLVGDRNLRLKQLGPELDRYDRLVAFAFIDGGEQSVQETMQKDGQARVSTRIGNKACAEMLLSAERSARASRHGLWANPNFAPLRLENIDRMAAARGQFALVEGKVLSVRESGATIPEFRAALDAGLYCHHSQASAGIRFGWHRSKTVGGSSDPGCAVGSKNVVVR